MVVVMNVDKMSLSFPPDVGEEMRRAAHRSGMSVSAWVTDAARAKLRREALGAALEDYQAEHGRFTAAEIAEAERRLGLGDAGVSGAA